MLILPLFFTSFSVHAKKGDPPAGKECPEGASYSGGMCRITVDSGEKCPDGMSKPGGAKGTECTSVPTDKKSIGVGGMKDQLRKQTPSGR